MFGEGESDVTRSEGSAKEALQSLPLLPLSLGRNRFHQLGCEGHHEMRTL